MNINIIGAGRVGKTIGRLIKDQNAATIKMVYNTNPESGKNAIAFIQQGASVTNLLDIEPADITLITTPDDDIEPTCQQLVKLKVIQPGSIVLHCCGTKTSDDLKSARELNCKVASVHPMRSFADPNASIKNFKNTYCAIEGDKEAVATLNQLFQAIGARTFIVDKNKKTIYHIAGVFASNYLVNLYQTSVDCLEEAGVDTETAGNIVCSLMQGTVNNLATLKSAKAALSGPIKRGDLNTVKSHIDALSEGTRKKLYLTHAQASIYLSEHELSFKKKLAELLKDK